MWIYCLEKKTRKLDKIVDILSEILTLCISKTKLGCWPLHFEFRLNHIFPPNYVFLFGLVSDIHVFLVRLPFLHSFPPGVKWINYFSCLIFFFPRDFVSFFARFSASAAMSIRSSLFWDVTQRWLVVSYQSFWTAPRSHLLHDPSKCDR
jgi:hypothetical protein